MLVLAVDVHEFAPDLLEGRQRDRRVVRERPAAPARTHHAPQQQIVRRRHAGGLEPRPHPGRERAGEQRLDDALLPGSALVLGPRLLSEGQPEGADDDRFSGAGLPGQGDQPAGELQVEPLDDRDVAQPQLPQHR